MVEKADKTIKELGQISEISEADTIPIWDDSLEGNNTKKVPIGMLEDKLNPIDDSAEETSTTKTWSIKKIVEKISAAISNLVPKTRTVNGKALSSDITLDAVDVNANNYAEYEQRIGTYCGKPLYSITYRGASFVPYTINQYNFILNLMSMHIDVPVKVEGFVCVDDNYATRPVNYVEGNAYLGCVFQREGVYFRTSVNTLVGHPFSFTAYYTKTTD